MPRVLAAIAALGLAAAPLYAPQPMCLPKGEVVAAQEAITHDYPEIRPGVYLIRGPNGRGVSAGQLTAYVPVGTDAFMSIFDRTDPDPGRWYNVSNEGPVKSRAGCAVGLRIRGPPGSWMPDSTSQRLFNTIVERVVEDHAARAAR